jgi:hypothetical protein
MLKSPCQHPLDDGPWVQLPPVGYPSFFLWADRPVSLHGTLGLSRSAEGRLSDVARGANKAVKAAVFANNESIMTVMDQ